MEQEQPNPDQAKTKRNRKRYTDKALMLCLNRKKPLTPIEIAKAIQERRNDFTTIRSLAHAYGTTKGVVSTYLSFLELIDSTQRLIHEGKISFSNARTLVHSVPFNKRAAVQIIQAAERMSPEEFFEYVKKAK